MMLRRLLLACLCLSAVCSALAFGGGETAVPVQREIRAVWLTTFSGLDWPRRAASTPAAAEEQKQTLCRLLDRMHEAGINTVLFQARLRGTTAYASDIEPWDGVFSGVPGRAPLYDPLAFAIAECHRRGMECHAWIVSFPIGKTEAVKALGNRALPKRRPALCQRCGDQWMMDPGVPGTDDYLAEICAEVARKYDVDGIHLDYIRYPEKSIAFNDNATFKKYGKGLSAAQKAQWRRDNVTRCVRKITAKVKAVRPWIKMSCAPIGKHADLRRYSAMGWSAMAMGQEAQRWLDEGLMDWLFPMMYFDGNHFYPFAADWQENAHGRTISSGLGIYFLSPREGNWTIDMVRRQLFFLRSEGIGHAFFRCKFLLDNEQGVYDFVCNELNRYPALIPPMTWQDNTPPAAPVNLMLTNSNTRLSWQVSDTDSHLFNIYMSYDSPVDISNPANLIAVRRSEKEITLPLERALFDIHYAVTAIDRYGNESLPATITRKGIWKR